MARLVEDVRMLDASVVRENRVIKKGDTIRLDACEAQQLVREGRAVYLVKVIVTATNVLVNNRVCKPGDTEDVSAEMACRLFRQGVVDVPDGRYIHEPLALIPPDPPRPHMPLGAEINPDDPPTSVKCIKSFFWGKGVVTPDTPNLEVPRSVAKRLVKHGLAKIVGMDRITSALSDALASSE